MAQNLSSSLGGPVSIVLAGSTYTLAPLDMSMLSEFERWLQADCMERAKLYARGLPADLQSALLQEALREANRISVTGRRGNELLQSIQNVLHLFYICVKRAMPDVEKERLLAKLTPDMLTEVQRAVSVASGADENNTADAPADPMKAVAPK